MLLYAIFIIHLKFFLFNYLCCFFNVPTCLKGQHGLGIVYYISHLKYFQVAAHGHFEYHALTVTMLL